MIVSISQHCLVQNSSCRGKHYDGNWDLKCSFVFFPFSGPWKEYVCSPICSDFLSLSLVADYFRERNIISQTFPAAVAFSKDQAGVSWFLLSQNRIFPLRNITGHQVSSGTKVRGSFHLNSNEMNM